MTTGSNNIHIGAQGLPLDNGKIKIGNEGTQTATYIAGISGTHVTGAAVYVTSSGQLGILASSERYKTAVTSMGSRTERLRQLRSELAISSPKASRTRSAGKRAQRAGELMRRVTRATSNPRPN